jgi:hypothetical protein
MVVKNLLDLLESEFIDELMGSLQGICSHREMMAENYKVGFVLDDTEDRYLFFLEEYKSLSNNMRYQETKAKIAIADKKNEIHSPNFVALKLFIHQIDASIDSMGLFFEREDNNSDNYLERFKPFLAYLGIIGDSIQGIKCLNRIYANIVDTDKISRELLKEGRYHQPPVA